MKNAGGDDEQLRFARYLERISMATRGIGILSVVGAVIVLLVAMTLRRTDDKIGFSLIALAVLLFGILVWSTGVFHGAAARSIPTLVRLERAIERLGTPLAARRATIADATITAVAAEPAPEPTAAAPAPDARVAVPPAPIEVEPPKARAHVEPEPARTPCPHCDGPIHPEATRCVHCMKRVAR